MTSCASPSESSPAPTGSALKKYLGDIELLESREKLYVIKDDLNKGQSRLAELDLEATTADYARKRAQLERRLKIRQLETKLDARPRQAESYLAHRQSRCTVRSRRC